MAASASCSTRLTAQPQHFRTCAAVPKLCCPENVKGSGALRSDAHKALLHTQINSPQSPEAKAHSVHSTGRETAVRYLPHSTEGTQTQLQLGPVLGTGNSIPRCPKPSVLSFCPAEAPTSPNSSVCRLQILFCPKS